jgi:hypothetical protein
MKRWFLILLLSLGAPSCGVAQQLPKSFFVGDSISIYYTPFVQTDVSTSFSFSRKTSPKPESIVEQLGFHGPYGILSWFYVSHCISTSGQGYGDV